MQVGWRQQRMWNMEQEYSPLGMTPHWVINVVTVEAKIGLNCQNQRTRSQDTESPSLSSES